MARGGRYGRIRERQVAAVLREDGWVVLKGTSFGTCDLVALRRGDRPRLIEVKGTRRPYEEFGPDDRAALLDAAARADADAVLAHWPSGGKLLLVPSAEWPESRRRDPDAA